MEKKVSGISPYQRMKELKSSVDSDKRTIQHQNKNIDNGTEDSKKEGYSEQKDVLYDNSRGFEGLTTYNKYGKVLDPKTIDAMKIEAEEHYSKMIETIKQMILKQGQENGAGFKDLDVFKKIASDYEFENSGTKENKTEANVPDGYWSAEATADRIIDFAKRISGGDTSKYELLKNAIQKGFDKAMSYFDKIPEITEKTHRIVMKKLNEWAEKSETASNESTGKAT